VFSFSHTGFREWRWFYAEDRKETPRSRDFRFCLQSFSIEARTSFVMGDSDTFLFSIAMEIFSSTLNIQQSNAHQIFRPLFHQMSLGWRIA